MKKSLLLLVVLVFNSILFADTVDELMKYSAKKTDFFGGTFSYELMDKVRVLEGNPADFITAFDNCYSYKNHELTESEENLFIEYFSYLPEKIQTCILDNVYAIYFVDGMNYGGFTDFIFDENRKKYCVIYFNSKTFNTDLNSWLEYRDNSIFTKTDEQNKVKVQCSDDYKGFLHSLTHEAGHVYDCINEITPYMDSFENNKKSTSDYYEYWISLSKPVKEYDNNLLSRFSFYYFGKQISVSNGAKLIDYLYTTPFSTLYGAKNFQDDFAETITFYWFKKKFNLNYKMEYINNGKVKAVYNLDENPNIHVWDSMCKEITGF